MCHGNARALVFGQASDVSVARAFAIPGPPQGAVSPAAHIAARLARAWLWQNA